MSEYRVHIENDWAALRYRVFLVQRRGEGDYLLSPAYPQSFGYEYTGLKEATALSSADYKPLVEIPYGAAHAVLGELSRVLGAVEHPLQLRADYEYERKRVDKLTDALIEELRSEL
jgi:hypothetical protein